MQNQMDQNLDKNQFDLNEEESSHQDAYQGRGKEDDGTVEHYLG